MIEQASLRRDAAKEAAVISSKTDALPSTVKNEGPVKGHHHIPEDAQLAACAAAGVGCGRRRLASAVGRECGHAGGSGQPGRGGGTRRSGLPATLPLAADDRGKLLAVAGMPVSPKGGRRRSVIAELLRTRPATPLEANPISQFYEIGRQTASAGPELIWKIYDAQRKSDKREASVFVFEKRVAEKLHKPKRKETVTEILRFSVRQLDRFKHPKLLTIYHPIEEARQVETLAFATEPVLGSLANILNCLEDRLPQCLPQEVRDYQFLDIEIKYGLLQLTEALSFLHYSCKLIHRNLCPQSVIVNKRGTWKLAGLEFTEKCSDTDLLSPATSSCSPLSDMFSLGLVICALFNNGRSIIEGNLSTTTYNKQLEVLEGSLHNLLDRVPHHLQEPLQGLLQVDPRRRPNAQNFSMIKYFMDPAVHGLQYLDVIQMKDSTHKSHFYHNLKTALPNIPKKLWWQHVLPSLKMELQSPEVLAAALQPLLFIIEESTVDEYQTIILPIFRSVFGMPKSVQATVTLLENLDVLMKKTPKTDIKADVLPMLYNSFDSTTPQIQCAAMHAIAQIADYLEESAVRKMVLPRTKQAFENNSGIKVQANALTCIEKIIDKLEKTDILDEVLPMLGKAKLQDPAILMPVVRIYKHMLSDKRYGLTVNLLATKVMPALIPVVVSPALKLDQFTSLIELLQEMLEHVSKSQRNKLKLEKLSIPSTDMLPVQTPYNMEQPTGYPHRPPSLRLESRRTSISMDDVVRRTCSSASSSPDSNLLRVQATLPGRRHSDNTIQPPRILVAPLFARGHRQLYPGGPPRSQAFQCRDAGLAFFGILQFAQDGEPQPGRGLLQLEQSQRKAVLRRCSVWRCRTAQRRQPGIKFSAADWLWCSSAGADAKGLVADAVAPPLSAVAPVAAIVVAPVAALPGVVQVSIVAVSVASVFAAQDFASCLEVALTSSREETPTAAQDPLAGRGQPYAGDTGTRLVYSATPAVFCHRMHSTFWHIGLRDLRTLHTSLRDAPFGLKTAYGVIWLRRVRSHITASFQTSVDKCLYASVHLGTTPSRAQPAELVKLPEGAPTAKTSTNLVKQTLGAEVFPPLVLFRELLRLDTAYQPAPKSGSSAPDDNLLSRM
ncbi:hypothetical protein MRX96_015565 [Rhipicephalus microplus]